MGEEKIQEPLTFMILFPKMTHFICLMHCRILECRYGGQWVKAARWQPPSSLHPPFLASSSYTSSSSSSSSWCPTLLWSEVLRPLSSCCCQLVSQACQHSEEIIWERRHHGHWGHHGHHGHCGLVRGSTSLYYISL